MNKQTEALKMAKQHIIERKGGRGGAVCYVKSDEEVIKAIDEALAQPAQEYLTRAQQVIRANNSAQEPVAWKVINHQGVECIYPNVYGEIPNGIKAEPLYTHPAPSWQGLSDDEIKHLWKDFDYGTYDFARAIEQALKEKNT